MTGFKVAFTAREGEGQTAPFCFENVVILLYLIILKQLCGLDIWMHLIPEDSAHNVLVKVYCVSVSLHFTQPRKILIFYGLNNWKSQKLSPNFIDILFLLKCIYIFLHFTLRHVDTTMFSFGWHFYHLDYDIITLYIIKQKNNNVIQVVTSLKSIKNGKWKMS